MVGLGNQTASGPFTREFDICGFADLEIEQLNAHPLQMLTPEMITTATSETLIVCTQFRLHSLSHTTPNEERIKFLQFLAKLQPSAVILSENDIACSCSQCGNFSIGYTRKVEYLWRFLDSTSCAFKGRDCDERRVFEGEASRIMMSEMEMNQGRERWCGKMREVGFVSEGFGEDVVDSGKSLLRKYDSNWVMKVDEKDGCACLPLKGSYPCLRLQILLTLRPYQWDETEPKADMYRGNMTVYT